jgi:hypothetical protein
VLRVDRKPLAAWPDLADPNCDPPSVSGAALTNGCAIRRPARQGVARTFIRWPAR